MYSILKNIFNREYNENYANRNRSNFAGGLADLRNGWAAMQNARKNKRDQAEYKNSMGNGGDNQYPNGSIGATGEGVYGVNSMPPQPNGGGIGVDANGVYGVNGTPQPNQSVFGGGNGFDWGKMGQMPTENSVMNAWGNQGGNPTFGGNGGFDWGKASPMPNGNSVMDAWGKQGGNSMFSGNSEKPDNTMNITSQTIGNNYNGRIDGQVGGLGIPQAPQGGGSGGFTSLLNGNNTGIFGKDLNPSQPPISSSDLAQGIGGRNVSANDLSKYLGNEYNRAAWIQQDMANNGVTNPLISMLRYDTKVAPLINAAKEEELRNAFFTLNNPNASEQDKMNAMALIEYRKGNPFLEEDHQYKMGNVENPDYGGGSSAGNAVLKALGDYTEGDQWMSPDGTGDSRTQCSNFVSDVLRKIGLNIGSPNGDELMRQFGKAYHTGIDGIQAGDVLNFKDHVGIYVGNGQYVARNSSGGVHQGSMEEAIQAFGQPLGYGSVGELTGTSRRQRFIKDPNRVSQREIFNANNAYRNSVINTRQNAIDSKYNKTRVKPISGDDAEQAIYDYADSEAPTFKQGHAIGRAWAQDFEDYAKEFDGDVGQAARQMYYDYAAMNPEERGWSMSSEKLALGVGYAYAHAKGLDGQKASKEAKKVMGMLLGQKPQNNTDTGASGGTSPKKGKKLSETATSSNPNGLDEREQAGALRELDEINHYDQKPTISNLNEVASFVKGDGRIGDGKIGDQLVGMVENAGTSRVTPKRRNR